MQLIARLFWPLLPVALLLTTYREAETDVRRYWALTSNVQETWDTYKDLQGVTTKVALFYRETQRLPADIPTLLTQIPTATLGRDREVYEDAWGTTYQLRDLGDTYEVYSCGPDRDCETELDNMTERVKKVKPRLQSPKPKLPGLEQLDLPPSQ